MSANHAIIECDLRRVTLTSKDGVAVLFIGDRALLNTCTRQLNNSLSSLFALLNFGEVESKSESSKIEKLPVVCEFPDVFSEDLWELPLLER